MESPFCFCKKNDLYNHLEVYFQDASMELELCLIL